MESFGKEQSSKPEPIELKHYTAKDDSPPPSYNGVQDADEEKNDLQESDNASGETEGETNEAFSHDEITSENAPTSDDVERGSISKDVEEEEKSVTDAKLDEGYFDGPWGKCAIATVMLATFFVISFGVGYGVAEIILKVEVKSCGTQTVLPNFDSNAVEPGNWPWHVALYKRDGSGNDYLCSGALVMENWVATSASCVHGVAKEDITVWAGKQSLSSAGDMDTGHVIKSIYPYWTFDGNDAVPRRNDVALLELYLKVELNDHVNTLCLPGSGKNVTEFGEKCYVTAYNTDLIQIKTDVTSNDRCAFYSTVSDGMFCGEHESSSPKADMGSPMVCENDGTWSLHGIAIEPLAFGYGIYTNMVEFSGFAEYVIYQYAK